MQLLIQLPGSDATVHMAEETRNASSVIPRAMMWSYVINGFMVFLMLVTYCFCLTDLAAATDSPTGYPFIAVFVNATGSAAGGAGITCLIVVLIVFSVTNYMASCSRQVFAFGRDKGLPFYTWVSKACAPPKSRDNYTRTYSPRAGRCPHQLSSPRCRSDLRLLHPCVTHQPRKLRCV